MDDEIHGPNQLVEWVSTVVFRSPQSLPARRLPCVTSFAFPFKHHCSFNYYYYAPWPRPRLHPAGQLSLQMILVWFVFLSLPILVWPPSRVWSNYQFRKGGKKRCAFSTVGHY
ncbi:hypothetical protein M752DRAFT_25862 [Aspergillus phoenicis ATCC 13157]|uniref:Uncharacterized protein n=1 Tax=Aspergillus phoenicis ATCC 13157 TaxID=1353007 RepID=A0A370PGL8_ASPPH|nr:hypothetical protein M752DRAFT_25862 [Aspergillus phoenicis ATCC 13157]